MQEIETVEGRVIVIQRCERVDGTGISGPAIIQHPKLVNKEPVMAIGKLLELALAR